MKRIISFVLCLSMLLSMVPAGAFAAEVDETAFVTEAVVETEAAAITEALAEAPEETEAEPAPVTEAEPAGTTGVPEVTEVTEAPVEEPMEALQAEAETMEPAETVPEEPEETVVEFTWIPEEEIPDSGELFAGYVDSVLYGTATFGTMAGSRLTGDARALYDAAREMISQAAAGAVETAEVILTDIENAHFSSQTEMEEAVAEVGDAVFYALLADMPYELYWFDKVTGLVRGYAYVMAAEDDLTVTKLVLRFSVSPDYSLTGGTKTYDLDVSKTGAASAAAENARAIVAEYAESDDYDKLVAYRDKILALTSYNDAAASSGYTGGYGDPWQLIWVFDGDVSTKVVCEGYSKAFQYLCDLSDFDADITCYNVQGYLGSGGHMWNVVTINGSAYLVDVTNSEVGTVGYKDKLFLVGGSGSAESGYTFAGRKFTYNDETKDLWGTGSDSILTLADSNFDPDSLITSTPGAGAVVATMTQEDFLAALESAGDYYELTDTVVISGDMELPELRVEVEGGTLLVEEGVTLTNRGGMVIRDGGAVIVEGSLEHAGWYLDVEDGGSLTVSGTVTGNDVGVYGGSLTAEGSLDIVQVHVDVLKLGTAALAGVPQEKLHYVANPATAEELKAALALVEEYNPWIGMPETLTIDRDVTIPAGANVAFENAAMTVASGATLTLEGEFTVQPNSQLLVEEGGTLVNNGMLTITNHSSHENGAVVTVDGELVSYGQIWITDGGTLNVGGSAQVYDAVHAGFGGNGLTCEVNVSGSLTTYGYLNIVPGTGVLNIAEGGAVTVGGYLFGQDGEPYANGYLQAGGIVHVYGSLTLDGGVTLGGDEYNTAELNVYEGGLVTVPQGNLWFDITESGYLCNEGTVDNHGLIGISGTAVNYAFFNNYGQIRLFGTGTCDDYSDAGFAGNAPVDGAAAQLEEFLNDLADGQGASLYSNITLAEDLIIDLGEDHVVLQPNSELHVPSGVTLTINSHVRIEEAALVVEEGGQLILNATNVDVVSQGALGCIIVEGRMVINDSGTLWLDEGASLEIYGSGVVDVMDDPATEAPAAIHVAHFSDGATVLVEGTLNTGGYINVTPGGWLTLREDGTLNIKNDAEYGCGYLDVTGMAQLWGTANLDGLMSVSNGNGTDEFVEGTARIEINGELNGSDTSGLFINPNASVGVCDTHDRNGNWLGSGTLTTAGEVIVESAGTLWVDGDVTLSGSVTCYGNIHVNCFGERESGNSAELIIDGEVANYGYLCVHPDGTLTVNGTLTIDKTEVDGQDFAGYLNGFGYMTVNDGGVINNYSLLDVDSLDGSGYLYIVEGGTLTVKDNLVMAVCDRGELIVDGTLNLCDTGGMEVYNGISGSGTWVSNGTVYFGVQQDEEGNAYAGYTNFSGRYIPGTSARVEVVLHEGSPVYVDLIDTAEQYLVYTGSDMDAVRTVLNTEDYKGWIVVEEELILNEYLTIPENVTVVVRGRLTVDDYLTLRGHMRIEEGGTLVNNSILDCLGTMVVNGTVEDNGDLTAQYDAAADTPASITGNIPAEQLWMIAYNITDGDALQRSVDKGQEMGYGTVFVHMIDTAVELTNDLTIPQNTTLRLMARGGEEPAFLTVPEDVTVYNRGAVELEAGTTLNILGTWEGGRPSGDGSILGNLPMTQEEFVSLLEEAAANDTAAWLNGSITLTEDLSIDCRLEIGENGKLIVPDGVTLTFNDYVDVSGILIVEEGGKLIANANFRVEVGGNLEMMGEYENTHPDDYRFALFVAYDNGERGGVSGIPEAQQVLHFSGEITEEALRTFIDDAYGYWQAMAHINSDLSLTGGLHIFDNLTLIIASPRDEDGNVPEVKTFYVPEGVTVTNEGCFQIAPDSRLVVDGEWEGNMPENYGELGGSFFVLTQQEFEAMLEENDYVRVQSILNLEGFVLIPEGKHVELTDQAQLTVTKGTELAVEGQLVLLGESVLTVEGTLDNRGYVSVRDWAVLNAEGGAYSQGDEAVLENVHWDDAEGNVAHATILGISVGYQNVIVNAGTERLIRELLDYANTYGAPYLEINVNEELTLASSLYLPENARLTVANWEEGTAHLTVPQGVTLYNDGCVVIGRKGILTVDGKYMGNLPEMESSDAQFIINGTVSFTQNDLEALLAQAAGNGTHVCLSIPLTLTKDLVIPENAGLIITGSGSITVPAGRTLTVNGWLDTSWGGQLLAVNGGVVRNRGSITAMDEGSVDLTGGVYEQEEWAQVYIRYRNEGYGTGVGAEIMGIPYSNITMVVTGWDEGHLRRIVSLANVLKPKRLELEINGEMTLTEDLTIPGYAVALIQDNGYGPAVLTVPGNVTLTNNGHIQIGWDGHLIVENGGALEGNQPIVFDFGGEYINNGFTETDLRAYIDRKAATGGEVFLSSDITLTGDLEIPGNVILVISAGGALRVPEGVELTVNGQINTQMFTGLYIQGGTVYNNGEIGNDHWGVTELTSGTYISNGGRLYEVHSSFDPNYRYDEQSGQTVGEKDAGSVVGIAPMYRTIVARGCSEFNIREVLDYAAGITTDGNYPNVEIWLTDGEIVLTEDLTIPAYATMNIAHQRQFAGSLIVPEGVTLYNYGLIGIHSDGYLEVQAGAVLDNASAIDIGWAGTMIVRQGGAVYGNHPNCYDTGSTYINENVYDQAYLEALLQGAQSAGGSVTLSVPVALTSDLVIPEGVRLYITGRDNFVTIPEGVTLTNNGSIYCHMFGGILGQGGWLHNNGEIHALNWGAVDMSGSWGSYSSDTGSRIHNHHWIYSDGTEGRGTVVGFYPSDVVVHTEGDVSRVLNEMVDFIWGAGDGENGVWSELDSTITGHMVLEEYLDWPIFGTMLIPEGSSLTVPAGQTLDIRGTVIVRGRLIIEEGAVVNTYYPICVDGGEITGGGENVRYYNPGVALESFTVTASTHEAAPGQLVGVMADSWTPANAEVLAFAYTVTGGSGLFGYDGEDEPMRYIIADPGASVQLTAEHGGEVTVEVKAIIGVSEEDELIYAEESHTVTVTFTGLTIGLETKDAPDYVENGIPGLWAGGKTILYPVLIDTINGTELPASAVEVSISEGAEQFAKIVNKGNIITITALNTVTQLETIYITFSAEGAAPEIYALNLRPKATGADVRLWGETVSGQTVLADLNRGDWGFQLEAAGISGEAVPETGCDWNGTPLVTWKSSAPAIATVDEGGWVSFTGEKLGKVKITMTANFGAKKTAVVTFNVTELPQEIFASESNPAILVGGGSGTYTVTDAEGSALKSTQVTWYLSDENGEAIASHPYAAVTAAGKLTTKAVADETKVWLMAQVIGDEYSAKLYEPVCVTIYPAIESVQILDAVGDPINGKTLLYDNSLHGLTYQLGWNAEPYTEAVQSVSWKSSKPAVADIDENGLITLASETASGAVKFTLTVTALNGKKSTAVFTMKFGIFTTALDLAVTLPDGTVTDDMSDIVVIGGDSLTFTGSCLPENVTTDGVVWSVLDKTYGAISAKGVLKTKAVNNPTVFTVIAESKDGYVRYTIDITLMPKQVSTPNGMMDALLIWNDDVYLTKSTHTMLKGSGMQLYANAEVEWKSSNTTAVKVNADGWLAAQNNGTATITATATDGSKRTATFTVKVSKLSQFVEITTKKGEPFTVASGKSLDLVATVTYSDGTTDKKADWSVDNTAIATISSSGKLAAVKGLTKAATVRVFADAKDGSSFTWQDVRVVPMTTALEIFGPFGVNGRSTDITNTTVTWDMLQGTDFTLNVNAYPMDAMQEVTWKSSSAKIATIDEEGNVTCVGSGTATITATAKDGSGKKATFKLTVMKTMEYLELPATASVGGGKTLTFTKMEGYNVDPLATNKTLNWSMTYPDGSAVPATVATLAKGVLKTKAVTEPVTVLVRAEATDDSGLAAECVVTICPITTAVTITNVPAQLYVGYRVDLDAVCAPAGAAQEVTWKSSSASVATVDADGVVTALKPGTVTITATAADGSGKKATAKFTVKEAAENVELSVIAAEYGNQTADWWMEFASDFNEAYPYVSLEVEVVSWMDIYDVVNARIESGDAPDILNLDMFAQFQADGLLLPAKEYISTRTYNKFFPQFLAESEIDGTVWAVPDLAAARALYYNADVLAEAGVEVPTTWAKLMEVCETLKETHPDMIPFAADMTENDGQATFFNFARNNGGGFVDENGNWDLNSEENVEAMEFLAAMVGEGLTNSVSLEQTRYDLQELFANGQIAMMIGPDQIDDCCDDYGRIDYGISTLPTNVEESVSLAVMDRMMCFDNSYTDAELAAVTTFFDFFYEDQRYAEWTRMEGFLPATSTGCEALAEADPTQAVWGEILESAEFYPAGKAEWSEVRNGVIDVLQITLQGGDARSLLNALQAKVTGETVSEISLWTYPVGGWSNAEVVESLVSSFEEETGIRVNVEYLNYNDGDVRVDTAIAAGAAPDLILEGPERLVANWGSRGLMVNIADLFDADDRQNIYSNVLNACFADSTTAYEYPLAMTAHCMAINKTVFEAAGAMRYIDQETHTWTTENFLKAVQAVYEYTGKQVGAVYCGGQGGDQGTRALVTNLYGGSYTNAEHTAYTWDSEEMINALKTLYDNSAIAFDPDIVGGDEIALFYNGTLNMAFCWNIAQQLNPNMAGTGAGQTVNGDEIMFMAMPSPGGTDAQLQGGIWGFGIFDNGDSARIEAAKQFIKYFCDSEATAQAVTAASYFPVRGDLEGAWTQDSIMEEYNCLMGLIGDYYQVTDRWSEARTAWWNMLQEVSVSNGSEAAITQIVQQYTNQVNP